MWTFYLPRNLLAVAFGCWCFHLSRACTTTSRCSEICEHSDWAKHAACGRRYLEDIPQVCCGVKSLDLRQNDVRTLRKGALKTFTNLKYIYLDRNNMSVVRKGAFHGCSKLEHLSMGENNFRGLTRRMLEGLEKVKYLIISRGKLKRIDRGTFLETPSLLTLDLQGNQLLSPPCEALPAGNILKTLFLSRNHISVFPRLCFQNFTELKRLHLNDNPIGDITNINVFQGLESLEELSLKKVSLSAVPVALFRDVNTLTTLIMSHNLIESLHERDFMGLPYLTTLNLESNRIVTVHEKAFSGLDFLKFLVLSNNRIVSIGQGALRPVEGTLHDLHLHGNTLPEIQNISSSFASLERIFIADNPLICTCQLEPLRQWLQLNRDVLSSTEGNATCTIPDTDQKTPILESNQTCPCLQTTPGTILLPEEERSTVDFEASTNGIFPNSNSTGDVHGSDLPRMFLITTSTIFIVLVMFMVVLLIVCFKARRRTKVEKDRESDSIYATVDDNSVEEIPSRLYNLRISYNPVYSTRIRNENNRTCSTSCSLCNGPRGLSSLSPSPPSPNSQRNPPVPSGSCRNEGHTNYDDPTNQRLAIASHSQCDHGAGESRNISAGNVSNADANANGVTTESKCPTQVSFSGDSGNNGINARKNIRGGDDGFTPEGENLADGVGDGGYSVAETSFHEPVFNRSCGLSTKGNINKHKYGDAINNSTEELLAGQVNTIWTRVSTKRSLKSDHRNYLQQNTINGRSSVHEELFCATHMQLITTV